MTNLVIISNAARPCLLDQTIETLFTNTPLDQFNVTFVLDGCDSDRITGPNLNVVTIKPPCHIIGRLKNLGVYSSEKQFGRGDWLCICDDDLAFFDGWLEKMQDAMLAHNQVRILGGYRHPYHGVNKTLDAVLPAVEQTDAVAGYMHFMRWSTWDRFGEYDAHTPGVCKSEDQSFCQKVVDAGGTVGYISPSVIAHTGVTNCEGNPAVGAEHFERVPNILYL